MAANGSFNFHFYEGTEVRNFTCTISNGVYSITSVGGEQYAIAANINCICDSNNEKGTSFNFKTEPISELSFRDVGVAGKIVRFENGKVYFDNEPVVSDTFSFTYRT